MPATRRLRFHRASTAAAGMLAIVEQVDPGLVREYLWRTLALRPSLRLSHRSETIPDLVNAQVAAMVARYDWESALAVLDSFVDRAIARHLGSPYQERSYLVDSAFTAAAAVDPARAVAMVETLADESDPSPGSFKGATRLAVAKVLSYDGPRRWRYLESSLLNLWPIERKRP